MWAYFCNHTRKVCWKFCVHRTCIRGRGRDRTGVKKTSRDCLSPLRVNENSCRQQLCVLSLPAAHAMRCRCWPAALQRMNQNGHLGWRGAPRSLEFSHDKGGRVVAVSRAGRELLSPVYVSGANAVDWYTPICIGGVETYDR